MHALKLRCRVDEKDWISAVLWELGTEGVTERELPDGSLELEAFFAAKVTAREFALFEPRWVEHGDEDWAESWKTAWKPLEVGRRWFLTPDWRDDPAPEGRMKLVVHARQASGSGYQPATQLALIAMEEWVHARDRFLEWGCGSGILSSAAHLLGARAIVACDVDAAAALEAVANLSARAVPADVFVGTGRSLRPGCFDVVAANMNAAAIEGYASELARSTRPGGRLILSGFKSRRAKGVAAMMAAAGLSVRREYSHEDWRCLVMM